MKQKVKILDNIYVWLIVLITMVVCILINLFDLIWLKIWVEIIFAIFVIYVLITFTIEQIEDERQWKKEVFGCKRR